MTGDSFRRDTHTQGPELEWGIFRTASTALRFQTAYLDTDLGNKFLALLLMSYRYDNRLSFDSVVRGDVRSGKREDSWQNVIKYDDRGRSGKGTRVALTNAEQRKQEERKFLSSNQLSVDHTSNYFDTAAYVRDVHPSHGSATTAGLNAQSSFLYSQEGGMQVSYAPKGGAVFIADVESKTTESKFDLIVNDQVYETLNAGQRTALGMAPYRSYRIKIRPHEGADIVNYDTKSYEVTLFPGNIVSKIWSAERVFIALGRVLDAKGQPIPLERVRGTQEYCVTEEDGSFQAEINGKEPLYIKSRNYQCQIKTQLPDINDVEYLVDLGDVVCE